VLADTTLGEFFLFCRQTQQLTHRLHSFLKYDQGDSPKCDGVYTMVSFVCDESQISPPNQTNADLGVIDVLHSIGSPIQDPATVGHANKHPCDYALLWKTFLACRICTEADYEDRISPCILGTKKSYKLRTKACVGPNTKASIFEECADSIELPIFAIIGAAAFLVVLLLILGFLFYRHKRLTNQYQLLADEKSKGVEMDEIDKEYEKTLEKATSDLNDDDLDDDDDESDTAKVV